MEIGIVPAKSMTGIVEEVMMAAVGIVSFFFGTNLVASV